MSPQKPVESKVTPPYLFGSAAAGIILFWLIGVWFLPERLLILKYFLGYIAAGVVITLFGAYVHEKGSGIVRRSGKAFLGIGFGAIGAFFALCFYLAISFTFFK